MPIPSTRVTPPIQTDTEVTMTSFVLNVSGCVTPRACVQPTAAAGTQRSTSVNCVRSQSGSLASSRQMSTLVAMKRTVKQSAMKRSTLSITAGPQPDTEEEGSALDFPEEYVRAVPSRRPDIFPDLKEPKTPMPKPMPGDPEVPDEEEEEEERKKNPGEPGTNPDEDEDEENPKPKKDDEEED